MIRLIAFACLVGFAYLTAPTPSSAQKFDKSDSKIKATAKLGKASADGDQPITVTIDIDDGWYIYANPVGNDELNVNRTKLSVKGKDKVMAAFNYPAGKEKVLDEKLKTRANIYEKRVVIEGKLTRTAGDNSPLELSIEVNSCSHKGECLLTGTLKVKVQ
jgi:hypothetical protein